MKKLRRIEITAFRRRTTVIVCGKQEGGVGATSQPDLNNPPHPAGSDPLRSGESDLKKTTQAQPGSLFPADSRK